MVNRVIQAKIVKAKRMRRAYLKSFSRKNSGPTSLGFINEKGKYVDIGLRSRCNVAKNSIDEYLITKFRFNPNSNESIYARNRGLHTDLTMDKEIILARLVQSRRGVGSIQGEEKFVSQLLIERETCTRRLFMGGELAFIIERRVTKRGIIFLRSSDFTGPDARQRAFRAHLADNIPWDEISDPS